MKFSRLNPFRLLNSVPFGIMLMALTAVYIAIGSARPWMKDMGIDDWPVVRNWFDKTDLQFFNSWPLKMLMALLVMNLIVVTWRRIPLTPPRYGVWCIHAGIITLICGTAVYYHYKVEGRVRMWVDPSLGPVTVDHFYDKDERSLYVRVGQEDPVEIPLPGLPRFKEYDDGQFGHESDLLGRGLNGIYPSLEYTDRITGNKKQENLAELVGCKDQKLRFDVIGFYPYALMKAPMFTTNPASNISGVDVSMPMLGKDPNAEWWLVGSDADPALQQRGDRANIDMRHVDASADMAAVMTDAAGKLYQLEVTLPNQPVVKLETAVGKTVPIGATGYTLKIESFIPNFTLHDGSAVVQLLQMLVTSPKQTFRRQIQEGRTPQTDFDIHDPKAGPMGKRQLKPMDTDLQVTFHIHDPFQLLPRGENPIKHTLLTPVGSTELIDIVAGVGAVPSEVLYYPSGSADIEVKAQDDAMQAPFAGGAMGAATQASDGDNPPEHPPVKLHLERQDHLRRVDSIDVPPPDKRDKDVEDVGAAQLVKIKASMGNWSETVYAPFTQDAADRLSRDTWLGGSYVYLPGAIAPLQVQLGNTRRPLPVRMSLSQFKVIPYDGAAPDDPNPMILDFMSTVALSDGDGGESTTEVARMNHPIYYNGGNWLFFQASCDSSKQRLWTELGVGNRPAIRVMVAGFVMIVVGLAYAFYAKPIIIRRMKANAIAKAQAEGKKIRTGKGKELVAS